MKQDASAWSASPLLPWPREVDNLDLKLDVARRIAERAADGEVIGIGSGSAAFLALWALGKRAASENLRVRVLTSSYETEVAAARLQLPLARLGQANPDWAVDGADEIDPAGRLLKGRGGALFREKLLWNSATKMVLAIDPSKHVERLGTRFPIPVEVHPDAVELVAKRLAGLGSASAVLRTGTGKDGPVFTESGFVLLDAHFDQIPLGLHDQIKSIPGVLETGLFEGYEYEIVQ
jgi:ribose 5-phosphate isomerase A